MTPFLPAHYADENVDGRVVRAPRRLGRDVVRAVDAHPPGTADEAQFHAAAREGRALLTHDIDMLRLAATWQSESRPFAGVIYCRPDKDPSVGDAIRALIAAVADLDTRPLRNRVHFLQFEFAARFGDAGARARSRGRARG